MHKKLKKLILLPKLDTTYTYFNLEKKNYKQLFKKILYLETKRGVDVFISTTILFFFLPIMLIIGVIIKLTSKGPILYKQKRLTIDKAAFYIYKFRTMVANAEEGRGAVWSKESDPRITRIGKFLRKSRLDELPQLFNVVIGDMSLVGPRPERPEIAHELEKKFPDFHLRYKVQAGLSGLAQISGGYASTIEDYRKKLDYDIEYINNQSLLLDFKILYKTIFVVLKKIGR